MTDEIALVTINNKIDKIIETNYSIKIDNDIKFFKHLTGKNDCSLSVIHDFDKFKFPIELKINNEFATLDSYNQKLGSLFFRLLLPKENAEIYESTLFCRRAVHRF